MTIWAERTSHLGGGDRLIVFRTTIQLFLIASILFHGHDTLWACDTSTGEVAISSNFPGGNVLVASNSHGIVELAPDLRGDSEWFYWYFKAVATRPGRVKFSFPQKVIGFENGAIGLQGPAISLDNGGSWDWLGTDTVEGSSFYYDFDSLGSTVQL
jgi:hypothetical protein